MVDCNGVGHMWSPTINELNSLLIGTQSMEGHSESIVPSFIFFRRSFPHWRASVANWKGRNHIIDDGAKRLEFQGISNLFAIFLTDFLSPFSLIRMASIPIEKVLRNWNSAWAWPHEPERHMPVCYQLQKGHPWFGLFRINFVTKLAKSHHILDDVVGCEGVLKGGHFPQKTRQATDNNHHAQGNGFSYPSQ